jgi:hypothetical protein
MIVVFMTNASHYGGKVGNFEMAKQRDIKIDIVIIYDRDILNSTIPWNVMLCSLVLAYSHFGGMYCPIFKLKIKLRKAISTEVNTEYNL